MYNNFIQYLQLIHHMNINRPFKFPHVLTKSTSPPCHYKIHLLQNPAKESTCTKSTQPHIYHKIHLAIHIHHKIHPAISYQSFIYIKIHLSSQNPPKNSTCLHKIHPSISIYHKIHPKKSTPPSIITKSTSLQNPRQ